MEYLERSKKATVDAPPFPGNQRELTYLTISRKGTRAAGYSALAIKEIFLTLT